MPAKSIRNAATFRVPISAVLGSVKRVGVDQLLRRELAQTRRLLTRLRRQAEQFEASLVALEPRAELTPLEIQSLMSAYSDAQELADQVAKKADYVASVIAGNIARS
jgi:hypothetical protein